MKKHIVRFLLIALGLLLISLILYFSGYEIHSPMEETNYDIVFTISGIKKQIVNYDYSTKELTMTECPCNRCNVAGVSYNDAWLYLICYGPDRITSWGKLGITRDFGYCNVSSQLAPVIQTNDFIWATHLKKNDYTSPIVLKQSNFFTNEVLYLAHQDKHPRLGTNVRYEDRLYFALETELSELCQLIEYDLVTKEEAILLTDSKVFYPAISPNGEKIVYSSSDGIYVFYLDSMKKEKIIDVEGFDGTLIQASWSETSEKIVYDFCIMDEDNPCIQKQICIYDFVTTQSECIFTGGERPYWVVH